MGKNKDAKRWKSIILDWTALLGYDHEEALSIVLTQREAAILKALLITAYWSTRWSNLTATADELDNFVAHIDYALDGTETGNIMTDFRDDPLDPCQVQYSKDAGETWLPMFRKDNCVSAASYTDIDNIYTDINNVENNNTTWAGDIVNVAPKWDYADEFSDAALCYAVRFYVDWVSETAIAEIQSGNVQRRAENDWLDSAADMLGSAIVSVIAFFAATPISLPTLAMSAVVYGSMVVIETLWDVFETHPVTDYEDMEARAEIACAMYQAMEGVTPQHSGWIASLSDWSTFGGAHKAIAESVHTMNQSADVFINYMMLMEDLHDVSQYLDTCDCPDTWEHTWDFTIFGGSENWLMIAPDWGQWVFPTGLVGEINHTSGDDRKSNLISHIKFDEAIPRCHAVRLHMTNERGTYDVLQWAIQITIPPNDVESENSGFFVTGEYSRRWDFDLENLNSMKIRIRASYTDQGYDYGEVIIRKITLYGVGIDPFLGRETS